MWSNLITMVATLSGCLLTGLVQARVARTARRETRVADQRTKALTGTVTLLAAVAAHRSACWDREDLRLSGAGEQAVREARVAARTTRSAITGPLATVCILLPELADQAEAAVQATYAMRGITNHTELVATRAASVAAEKQLRHAASRVFALTNGQLGNNN